MFKENLMNFVSENPQLVTMKSAGDNLYVLKYTRRVFYNNLWNDFLEECRGTIVDADFNVVSRPFTKVYNYGVEDRCPVFDKSTPVTAYRKVNGFMVCVTWHNGDVLVSTTGSTTSDYVQLAKDMMTSHMDWADWQIEVCGSQGLSLMFECVHPDDPHIVPEQPGMYFLGFRENTWGSQVKGYGVDVANLWKDYAENVLNCYAPESLVLPLDELQAIARHAKHEGYVAYTQQHESFKIKSPYYLVNKALARKKDILSLNKELVEEEYYPLVNHLTEIKDRFNALSEQDRLVYMRQFLEQA